jgi:hypothetical protein
MEQGHFLELSVPNKKTKLRGPDFPFGEAGWKPPTSKAEHLLLEGPKK